MTGIFGGIFNFADYGALLALVSNSLYAGAALGIVGGLVSVVVMTRDLPFAVHGTSELSFAGAAGALLLGINVVVGAVAGSIIAALILGLLGIKARDRNTIVGVLMPFGLGLGVLFLALYKGRSANKFGLLTGQIVSVDDPQLGALLVISIIVVLALLVLWRPLMFAGVDADVAAARGLPVRALSPIFMLVLGLAVAMSVQIVGALLVLSIICTPGAAAMRVTAGPVKTVLLSTTFATVSMLGGILLAIGSSVPISPFVTTISFAIYLACRVVDLGQRRRTRRIATVTGQGTRTPGAMQAVT